MSDIADQADQEIETNIALFVALQRRRGTIVIPDDWDGLCTACGEEITPEPRKALGYSTCLECQQDKERFRA